MNAEIHPSSAPATTVRLFLFAGLWSLGAAFVFVAPVRAVNVSYTADSSAAIVTWNGNDAVLEVPSASGSFTQSGVISGTGSLFRYGPGTLTLSAANTYSGNTYIQEGTTIVANGTGSPVNDSPFGTNTSSDGFHLYGGKLIVNSDVKLKDKVFLINGGATVDNRGTIESAAPVWSGRGPFNVVNTGTIHGTNYGEALSSWEGQCTLINTGGTIFNDYPTAGQFDSPAAVVYDSGGTITNQAGGKLTSAAYTAVTLSGGSDPKELKNLGNSLIQGTSGAVFGGGTLTNDASTIKGTVANAISVAGSATVNNSNVALIDGLQYGIMAENSTTTVNNTGGSTIKSGLLASGGVAAVSISGSAGGVVNNGAGSTISGATRGVWMKNHGTVHNEGSGARIESEGSTTVDDAAIVGGESEPGSTTPVIIENLAGAVISGRATGVDLWSKTTVTNSGGSTIQARATSGTAAGVYSDGGACVVNNLDTSTISGRSWGVYLAGGGTVTNEGTISGTATGSGNAGVRRLTTAATLINKGVINGGVLTDNLAHATTLYTGSVVNGTFNLGTSANATLTLDGTGNQLYSNAVIGTTTFRGVLNKLGAGTWILDKAFTHTGATTVQAGTLLVNSTFGNTTVTIQNGATLGGTGTLGGNVTIQSGGRIAPGSGIGTLTIGSAKNLTWAAGGTMAFELGATASSDRLAIAGALTKSGATGTWAFDFAGTGQGSQDYTVATFASTTFTVTDFTATNLAPGLTGHFVLNSTSLHYVTDAPAPAITSAGTASGTYGSVFSFTVTASNSPTGFSETGTLPAGLVFNASGAITGTPTEVGTFNITVRADNAAGFGTASLAITVAAATVTPVVTISSRPYNSATAASIATRSLTGVIGSDMVTLTGGTATFADANVGTKSVSVTGLSLSGTGSGKYTLNTTTLTVSGTITAAPLTPAITVNGKTYDGTAAATIATRSLNGVIGVEAVTLTGGTATFADANAGVGKTATITGFALSGAAAGNYALASGPATAAATITPAVVTPAVTISDRPYNGTASAAIATRSLTGRIGTDDVTLTGGTAAFADANIGTAKSVSVTGLTLDGTAAGNYTLGTTTLTASATITAAPLTPVIAVNDKVYDGATTATIATRSVTGVIGSESVTLGGGTATFTDANAGVAKTVTITGYTLGGGAAGNYVLVTGPATATATITPKSVTPAVTISDRTYNGTTAASIATRSLTGRIGTDDVTLIGGTAAFADANIGTAKSVSVTGLTLGGTATGNYTLDTTTLTASATITVASLTPVVTVDNKTYDSTTAAIIATRSLTGVIGGESVTLTGGSAVFSDANVGTGKTVNIAGLTLGGTAAGNYALSTTTLTVSGTITAAPLMPVITVNDKVYDGATTATIATRSVTGVFGSDAVTLTGGSATFANANAGAAKTVTITGFALGGAAANYALAAGSVTATATITPAPVTPTVTIANRTYNGTTVASIATRLLTGVIGSDAVTLTGGTALFSDANVGAAKSVTITGLTLGGAAGANYVLSPATATASITPAPVTPIFAVSGKIYDGTVSATIVAMSLSGVFGSDDVRLTGATATFSDPTLGAGKPVTITGFTLAGGSSANYILAATSVTKTADIDDLPQKVTVTLGNLNQVYDGTPKTVSVVTDPPGIRVVVTYNGSDLPPTSPGRYTVMAAVSSRGYEGGAISTLVIGPAVGPMSSKVTATMDGPATFSAPAAGGGAMTYQWQKNGVDIPGETGPTLTLAHAQPADVGFYSLVVTSNGVATRSAAIPLELSFAGKISGSGIEVGSDIVHPNGNVYDQVLLTGAAVSVKADPGQVLRVSYVDLTDDIVQVEFSGAGVLTLTLDNPSGPAPASKYDQPGVNYMKGHGSVVITGADATTNLNIFSVGRITAVNQALFRSDVTYDGWADLALVGLVSTTGKFGGVRAGNVSFFQAKGLTGIYAASVQVDGPMIVGDLSASDTARPLLVFAAAADARVAGGDLFQANGSPVEVDGLTRLVFTAGTTSGGVSLPAQSNRARFVHDGIDVTNQLVP